MTAWATNTIPARGISPPIFGGFLTTRSPISGNLRNFQRTIKMNQVQSFNFGNVSVSFRDDGYLNATAIAAHFGKRVPDFIKTEQNQEYINALAEHISKTTKIVLYRNQLVIVKHGGNNRGTWLHPKLAVHFARWLDPKFAVWCDEQIEQLLSGSLQPKPTKALPLTRHVGTNQSSQRVPPLGAGCIGR